MTINIPGETSGKSITIEKEETETKHRSIVQFANHRLGTISLPLMVIIVLLAIGSGAFYLYSQNGDDSKIVRLSGRIESPETHISAPTATRVKSVAVKQGDSVYKGQLIVTLDSQNLQKRLSASAPALKAALHAQRETDVQVAAVQTQISAARAKSQGFFAKIFSTKSGR